MYEHSGCRRSVSYLDIDGAQSSRRGEYVTKSRLILRSIARPADHVTRSDWHDWHADQCYPRGDDTIQCYPRGNDAIQYYPKGDDAI